MTTITKKATALITAFIAIFAMLSASATPAFAAADLTGTVTDSANSPAPLEGVTVYATSPGKTTQEATTDSSGNYTFTGLAAADWKLQFTKVGWVSEWYNNRTTFASATAITIASTPVTANVTRLAASVGSIQGKVYKRDAAGTVTPVENASLTLYKSGEAFSFTATSNGSGSFTWIDLPAGTYTYKAESGYFVDGYYGAAATLDAAAPINLTSGALVNKNVILTASGTISGTVSDSSGAVIGVNVKAYESDGTYVTVTQSNGSGQYTFSDLTPKSYYLEFSETSHEPIWYDNKLTFAAALSANSKVTVAAGVDVTGKNATLPITANLTNTVANPTINPSISGTAKEGLVLTANNGTWASGVDFNYWWERSTDGNTYTAIPNGRLKTYTLTADDYNHYVRVVVLGTKSGYRSAGMDASPTARVAHAYTALGTPTITGTPTVGQVLTIEEGTWAPTPTSYIYQWYAGGVAIANATDKTYTLTDASAGKVITATVTPVKTDYPTAGMTRTTAATLAVGKAITVSPTPTITGQAAVGKVLTAVPGAWTPSNVTFSYQWMRSGTNIVGATSSTYTPVAADLNYYISVTVTGSLATYTSVSKTSSPTSAVLDKMTATPLPTITGVTLVGNVLTVNPGVWAPSGISFTYRWLRNNIAIPNAINTTYTLVQADDLTNITVRVNATKSGYGDEEKVSLPVAIGKQFTNHNAPTLKGNNWVGQTLKATIGLWDSAAVLTHQWLRDGVAIAGATGHNYLLTKADVGHKITLATTGTAAGYVTKVSTSAPTAVILSGKPFTKKPSPVITGTLKVGQTLGVKVGTWSPTPTKYYYQWLRNLVPITGATAKTYKLTAADLGTSIRVRVKVAKPGYATTAITSRPSAAIK